MNPAVGPSSSMSSVSSEALGKGQATSSRVAREAALCQHGISSLDSWENGAGRVELSPGERRRRRVGSDLDEPSGPLSEADCHYLVQQNRALLEQANLQQARYHRS